MRHLKYFKESNDEYSNEKISEEDAKELMFYNSINSGYGSKVNLINSWMSKNMSLLQKILRKKYNFKISEGMLIVGSRGHINKKTVRAITVTIMGSNIRFSIIELEDNWYILIRSNKKEKECFKCDEIAGLLEQIENLLPEKKIIESHNHTLFEEVKDTRSNSEINGTSWIKHYPLIIDEKLLPQILNFVKGNVKSYKTKYHTGQSNYLSIQLGHFDFFDSDKKERIHQSIQDSCGFNIDDCITPKLDISICEDEWFICKIYPDIDQTIFIKKSTKRSMDDDKIPHRVDYIETLNRLKRSYQYDLTRHFICDQKSGLKEFCDKIILDK